MAEDKKVDQVTSATTGHVGYESGESAATPSEQQAPANTTAGQPVFSSRIPGDIRVIKRNGQVAPFEQERIKRAVMKAFLDVEGSAAAESGRIYEAITELSNQVMTLLNNQMPSGGTVHIEEIQDKVEAVLMRNEYHKVARSYIHFRDNRARIRAAEQETNHQNKLPVDDKNLLSGVDMSINIEHADGQMLPLDTVSLQRLLVESCAGLADAEPEAVVKAVFANLYDGISANDIDEALIISTSPMVEINPVYSRVTARLLLNQLRKRVVTHLKMRPVHTQAEMKECYADAFVKFIECGVDGGQLNPELKKFDLQMLGAGIQADNDLNFSYQGLKILVDRYLLHDGYLERGQKNIYELPQLLFMRVAMGLALNEDKREQRALEFYNLLSNFDYMCSTPTLFNAGTMHSQLSSCYLTTVPDNLNGIYGSIRDNALLSKWAGGLGNDWTPVRALGADIRSTNGKSQGVVPFLKVVSDTAVAVNQGGKRKGAVCAYLETWHFDIEEFLDLRKNTGDDRRRTHDMHTANWIPDLFMQRVIEDKHWTLFSPDMVPDLHDLYGRAFTERYEQYEAQAELGELMPHRKMKATDLWRKMLDRLYETGHPWMTFKDACNIRSPQRHAGVIHSSNLCTEITLNTSSDEESGEIAVCNLGSINLAQHITPAGINKEKLAKTVATAMRMLDNVIDINYYAVKSAKRSNSKHRPVGLGLMGLQDALVIQRIPYASDKAVEFSDRLMEIISYHAISASVDLAEERGAYESFQGSLWSKGQLPIDSLKLLAEERNNAYLDVDTSQTLDWQPLRERVQKAGMRNSNVMAIAPTATIANIVGVNQSTEPTFEHLYSKSNLSGDFAIINERLVADLNKKGMWDQVMLGDLKYFKQLSKIQRIPADIRKLYATAFEIEPEWLIKAAARRQKWIDQSQSLNLYIDTEDGRVVNNVYIQAWLSGLKTTYYLRTQAATSTEQSTVDKSSLNSVKTAEGLMTDQTVVADFESSQPQACAIDDEDCEACQ